MSAILTILLLAADPAPAEKPATPEQQLIDRLHALNLAEARKWEMFTDQSEKAKAELVERPVYLWTNPLPRFGFQYGSVFVWLHEGRPLVVGSIFAHPIEPGKAAAHSRIPLACPDEAFRPLPRRAGQRVGPQSRPGAEALARRPAAERSATRRLIQIRSLAREFSGHTIDHRKLRWELRLLGQPLVRYEKPQGEIIDGALLALVSDAGTDPEVLLLLEARQDGWHYALLRFCDASAWVNHKDKEVWTAVRDSENVQLHNPDHTYQVFEKQQNCLRGRGRTAAVNLNYMMIAVVLALIGGMVRAQDAAPQAAVAAAPAGVRRALIFVGLPGDPPHRKEFADSLELLYAGLTQHHGFATDNVILHWADEPTEMDGPASQIEPWRPYPRFIRRHRANACRPGPAERHTVGLRPWPHALRRAL